MCTLLLCTRMWDDLPLLVGANRDERLARESAPPAIYVRDGGRRVLAPRDLVAGGTWLGVSEGGVFAGLTNRAGSLPDATRRSRGELVFLALEGGDARAGAARIAALDAAAYNPFHLFVADRGAAFLLWSDGASMIHEPLGAGVHVLTERSLGAATQHRADSLLAWAQTTAKSGPPSDGALRARLAVHDLAEPFEAPCVHVPAFDYGTRASTIVRMGRGARELSFAHTDGPPCTTVHEPKDALVAALLGARAHGEGGAGPA